MKIALCGPASVKVLEPHLDRHVEEPGYSFPMTAELGLAYARAGHSVCIVSTSGGLADRVGYVGRELDIRLQLVPSSLSARRRGLTAFQLERKGVAESLRSFQPDVVHAHWTYEFALGALTVQPDALITVHDWPPTVLRYMPNGYRLTRLAMAELTFLRGRHFSAPSKYLASKLARRGVRAVVIPNGVSRRFMQTEESTSRFTDRPPLVGMLNGAFDRLKNVELALRAWPAVAAQVPGARLLLAGQDFGFGGPCHRWAKAHGLDNNIEFVGPVPSHDVPAFMRQLRLFLHTSREESFGMVLVEAMASGTPALGFANAGAVGEVIDSGGRVLSRRSPIALTAAIVGELRRPGCEAIESARRAVLRASEFDLSRVADRYLLHLHDLLSQRARSIR